MGTVLVSILSTTGTGRVAEMVDPHCAHILVGGAANKQLASPRRKARAATGNTRYSISLTAIIATSIPSVRLSVRVRGELLLPISLSVCPSVCLYVCMSNACIV